MIKRKPLLCLLIISLVSGCVDKLPAQAEEVGWDQTRYESYSGFYTNLVKEIERGARPSPYSVEDVMIEIHPDKNEFENLWYQVFINMKRGLEARARIESSGCTQSELYSTKFDERSQYCRHLYQTSMQSSRMYFQRSAEYRQNIEDMKANLSR